MANIILLASGGLDSTTLAYWLVERRHTIVPLFFDYGQHCVEKEWSTLQRVLPSAGVKAPLRVDISGIFANSTSRLIKEANLWAEDVKADDLYIPYRTLLFFSAAAAVGQTHNILEVFSGFINSNHAKELDCTSTFFNSLDRLSESIGPVRFIQPFRELSKTEVVEIAKELKVPIGLTFSCQVFSDIPCGACPNCVDRIEALKRSGLYNGDIT